MGLPEAGMPIPTDPAIVNWTIQRELMAITISLTICALITVLCRIYIRIFMLRVFGLDDYFIVIAMICCLIGLGFFLNSISLGLGRHFFVLPPESYSKILHSMFVHGMIVPLSTCFVKLSITFFLLRIAEGTRYRHVLWCLMAFLAVFTFITCFSLLFMCVPIQAIWDFTLRPPPQGHGTAKCLSWNTLRKFGLFNSATNIATDILLALMPIPLIWTLQVDIRTKVSLILVLGLGFFACGAAIIRTTMQSKFFKDPDFTGPNSWYIIWQFIELDVGIMAATLPALKPAFRWLLETAKALTTGVTHPRSGRAYKRNSSLGYVQQRDVSVVQLGQLHNQDSDGCMKYPRSVRIEGGEDESTVGMSRPESNGSSDGILIVEDVQQVKGIVKTTKVTMRRD